VERLNAEVIDVSIRLLAAVRGLAVWRSRLQAATLRDSRLGLLQTWRLGNRLQLAWTGVRQTLPAGNYVRGGDKLADYPTRKMEAVIERDACLELEKNRP
jgi:hypothetical protein